MSRPLRPVLISKEYGIVHWHRRGGAFPQGSRCTACEGLTQKSFLHSSIPPKGKALLRDAQATSRTSRMREQFGKPLSTPGKEVHGAAWALILKAFRFF